MANNNMWSSFLRNEEQKEYEYRFRLYCEELLSKVQLEFQNDNPATTVEKSRMFAMALIMKEMLGLQYEYAPDTMKDMTVELFLSLPQMHEFRRDFVRGIQEMTLGKNLDDIEGID